MIKSKLPDIGTTIFTKMSAMANAHGALNVSQGFPDFDCKVELQNLLEKYTKEGFNQYAPMQGSLKLREKVAEKTLSLYNKQYDINDEITITAGATQAIFTIITACIRLGDEVIVFGPAYDCYEPAVRLCGGQTKFLNLEAPNYQMDFDQLQSMITSATKMIIINTPHNPTGALITDAEMKQLEQMLDGTEILVLSDEVYEHIIFDGQKHCSVVSYPGLASRSFSVSSFGKTYHITGWKLGYCLGPKPLMKEFRKVHQFNVFCCSHPSQLAIAEFMDRKEEYLELPLMYQKKRDRFLEGIEGSRFKFEPAKGTFFQLLDYSNISDLEDVAMAEKLVKDHGIASIPISVFYEEPPTNDRMLRFCFAKGDDTIDRACEILKSI